MGRTWGDVEKVGAELIGAHYPNALCPRGEFSLIKGKIMKKKASDTGPVDEFTQWRVSSRMD